LAELLPHLAGVVVDRVERVGGEVRIWARAADTQVCCPGCGVASGRVYSRYERRLADAALGGLRVEIRLRVRLLVCQAADCEVRRFAEQVPELTFRYGRRSLLLVEMLQALGLALAGRAAARLAGQLGVLISRSTMLRLVRGLPDPAPGVVRVLTGYAAQAPSPRGCHGSMVSTPEGAKPAALLVTAGVPCTSAVPTISESRTGRGSGMCRSALRRATAVPTGRMRSTKAGSTCASSQRRRIAPGPS
jgi:hypothetical protein